MACYEYKGVKYTEEDLVKLLQSQQLKTRRILELQSDLFQKGRDKKDLVTQTKVSATTSPGMVGEANMQEYLDSMLYSLTAYEGYSQKDAEDKVEKERKRLLSLVPSKENSSENQFLQLLNKDNNWVTFFVKAVIQDSVNKGYEKVLFPSGNTSMKIEGHTTLEEFKKQKEDRLEQLEKRKKKLLITANMWKVTEVGNNDTKVWFDTEEEAKEYIKREETKDSSRMFHSPLFSGSDYTRDAKELKSTNEEITQLKQELERVETEGFGALKPIYNFYENTVTNILKKQGYNPEKITDEYGNTWNEIAIDKELINKITLQKESIIPTQTLPFVGIDIPYEWRQQNKENQVVEKRKVK